MVAREMRGNQQFRKWESNFMADTPTVWINLTGGPVKVKKVGGGVLEISASGPRYRLKNAHVNLRMKLGVLW